MDKAALLDAIAKSGSAGRAAYEQAQQALAGQQAEAVRMALASGVAGQAPSGAQAEIERIVSQPYQSRTAQLQQNQASMEDWYNRLSASRGSWADQQKALQDFALQQALAEATGGGGGGGGRTPQEPSWYENVKDVFGTGELAKPGIEGEAIAAGAADWRKTGMSPAAGIRQFAINEYGVPEGIGSSWYPESPFVTETASFISGARTPKQARNRLAIIRSKAQKQATGVPGTGTGYAVRKAREEVAQRFGPKTQKAGWSQGAKRIKRRGQKGD